MTINIVPDFQVYHSVTVKEAKRTGVIEARQAYNIAVGLKVDNVADIILPKLIKDKIDKNLNVNQKPHFYNLVREDNSASGNAGFQYDTCVTGTAKSNSFKDSTVILSLEEELPNSEIIENNDKIIVCSPAEFITKYHYALKIKKINPKFNLEEALFFVLFIRPCFVPKDK